MKREAGYVGEWAAIYWERELPSSSSSCPDAAGLLSMQMKAAARSGVKLIHTTLL